MSIEVECYSGFRADERPLRLRIDGRRVEIRRVLRQWREPGRECFDVECEDGSRYELSRGVADDEWRLVKKSGTASRERS